MRLNSEQSRALGELVKKVSELENASGADLEPRVEALETSVSDLESDFGIAQESLQSLVEKVVKATTSIDGLMSKEDKAKLDGIEAQANKYVLPQANASTIGGVKQATTVASVSASNAGTIGNNFNQTEVQKIATLADANKTAINAILSALKTAGIMA